MRESDKEVIIKELRARLADSEKGYDLPTIDQAIVVACQAHKGQSRASGEEYVCHPLRVAGILVDLGMDSETIEAALLHDVVAVSYTHLDVYKRQRCASTLKRWNMPKWRISFI